MAPLSRAPGYTATQHSMRVPQDHASGLRPIEWNSSSDTAVSGSFESALADRVARRDVGTVECTVTSTADAGAGTLRSCIVEGNGNDLNNEKPRIVFDFLDNADDQSVDGAASVTITLETELPAIAVPMVIDGGTRSYVVEGDGGSAKRTTVGVILDGSGLSGTKDGLKLSADDVELRGIAIVGFSYNGVAVYGKRAKVQGEFRDNGEAGVRVWPAALDAFIGGGSSQLPTIIGGNANGIHCEATRLTVQGNVFIGVDAESNDLGNSKSGVWLKGAATFATIGSSNSNSTDGIVIGRNNAHGICSQAPLLLIAGNVYIGEDPHGKKIGNSQNGVYSSSYDLTIGSDSTDAAVVIGWNLQNGISGRNKRLSVVGNVFIVGNGFNGISIQGSDAIIGTIDSTVEFGGMASEINIYIHRSI